MKQNQFALYFVFCFVLGFVITMSSGWNITSWKFWIIAASSYLVLTSLDSFSKKPKFPSFKK